MRFTKPAWVVHHDSPTKGEQAKRLSIFSVSVHPDGSRIATGGLDARVRIWSTKPILNQASELSNRPPKSLSTLTMHGGPVLTVRWAHSGRWLASGSDDMVVMIWDLDPSGGGKVWGTDDVNVEGWKALKRLVGHESDVTDVSWAPDDRYLASVGLDSKVIIWCGYTLDRLRALSDHQGFVKGVCWDPVGEFLATQSDDKTVKIWRTTDWGLEAVISKPFEDSPGSTFFRRLSWSPDGAHITASNAMNNNGYVFVAAVIARTTWTSEISLVGHENTVEVAAYNPNIFLRNPQMTVATSNICSVVALGADDRSVSVWQTKSARPLIVAKEVFERQILDLSWSQDGLTLYAVSSDGTMGVFNFDREELEGIAPRDAQIQYLQKFGFTPPNLPNGYSHNDPSRHTTPPPTPPPGSSANLQSATSFSGAGAEERVNVLVAKKGKKKRVQPTFAGSLGSSGQAPRVSSKPSNSTFLGEGSSNIKLPPPPLQSISRAPSGQGPASSSSLLPISRDTSHDIMDVDNDMSVPIDALDTTDKGKRRFSDMFTADSGMKVAKARTLGGDRVRENIERRPIREAASGVWFGGGDAVGGKLPVPVISTVLECKLEDSVDLFEATNPEDPHGVSEVTFRSGSGASKTVQWLDYLPHPALLITATNRFCAVALEDGSINVYSHTGRRIMPTLALGSPCSFLESAKNCLMAITATGQLYVWNVKQQQAVFASCSVLSLIMSSPNSTIASASLRTNGSPLLYLSTGVAVAYDPPLLSWVKVSEVWWSQGSTHWKRQRTNGGGNDTRGIVSVCEGRIAERITDETSQADRPRPEWWSAAMTLGHLETRLHGAKVLDSPAEYKQALLLYAKMVADEGFRGKAEELVKELYGPIYWRAGLGRPEDGWSPTVLGLAKRDLVKDVLQIFARSKTLCKLATEYQDLLKKSLSPDD